MPMKYGILDLRQNKTDFDRVGDRKMFTITKIYIDGFRNISKTTITLAEPITVLLAPNNFGKTNVLHAIEFAAALVSKGIESQEKLISDNGYTSYDSYTDSDGNELQKIFSFGIEFMSGEIKIGYEFQISPKKGVLSEKLRSGFTVFYERGGENVGTVKVRDASILVRPYNLLVSVLMDADIQASRYADMVRKLFFGMSNIFCNRESPFGDYSIEKRKMLFNLNNDIIQLYREEPEQYNIFKATFLSLFESISNFDIYDVRDRSRKVLHDWKKNFNPDDYRPEDYRLEFTTAGKKRPELYTDLSTGTQDIFLILLEAFIKRLKPLVVIEEIENGIHPSLYRRVLSAVDKVCQDKRVLVTTHSPSVARHFDTRTFTSFYVGIPDPNRKGLAAFYALDSSKRDDIEEKAKIHGISVGELIIDMLSDTKESIEELKGWLRVQP